MRQDVLTPAHAQHRAELPAQRTLKQGALIPSVAKQGAALLPSQAAVPDVTAPEEEAWSHEEREQGAEVSPTSQTAASDATESKEEA